MKNVRDFLEYMFDGQRGHVELLFIMGEHGTPSVKSFPLFDPGWLDRATNRVEKLKMYENCYFGVCPRTESVEKHAQESQVVDVPHLWTDIDGKFLDVPIDEHMEKVMAMDLKPTLVIASGNGYHCYWRLKETYHVKSLDHKAYIKGIIKGLTLHVQGDSTFNLDRVLRVPFTFNRKDKNNIKEVCVVHFDPALVYDVRDFEPMKVEVDVDELHGDAEQTFRPLRLEDFEEHRKLVRLAKDRLMPHFRKIQRAHGWPEMFADVIVENLANGIVEYVIDPPFEADIDMEDNMFILHTEDGFERIPLEEDVMRVIRHMSRLRKKVATRDKINLADLPFALRVRILNGTAKGGRSDLDYKVIYELRRMGYTPRAIREIYEDERFKIGEKYRGRQNRAGYLMSIIRAVDKKMENAE